MSDFEYQNAANEIRDLALALLADTTTAKIILKYQANDNMTEGDTRKLLEFADAHPSMQRFNDPRHPGHSFVPLAFWTSSQLDMARMHNPHIAIAVARGVAAGRYASVDDEVAIKLVEENLVPGDKNLDPVNGVYQWRARKLTLDEYYEVLTEVWPDKRFQKALSKAIKALAKVNNDFLDRSIWIPARKALDNIPYMAMLKRGWVSDPNFWSAAMQIQRENIDILDKEAIREKFEKPSSAEFRNIKIEGAQ